MLDPETIRICLHITLVCLLSVVSAFPNVIRMRCLYRGYARGSLEVINNLSAARSQKGFIVERISMSTRRTGVFPVTAATEPTVVLL
jgi:hypothetical protein